MLLFLAVPAESMHTAIVLVPDIGALEDGARVPRNAAAAVAVVLPRFMASGARSAGA